MKKIFSIVMLVVCVFFACMFVTACDNISKEEYDKLNNEYNDLLEEKRELEKLSDWLELYRSIKIGQTFQEISAMCRDYPMGYHGGGKGIREDGSTFSMDMYGWENRDLFDMYQAPKNEIVIFLLDDVCIFKEYGYVNAVLDNGSVRFPAPTDISQDSYFK